MSHGEGLTTTFFPIYTHPCSSFLPSPYDSPSIQMQYPKFCFWSKLLSILCLFQVIHVAKQVILKSKNHSFSSFIRSSPSEVDSEVDNQQLIQLWIVAICNQSCSNGFPLWKRMFKTGKWKKARKKV